MIARIYKPTQTVMQAGHAGTRSWILEYEPAPLVPDPLMGWTSTQDTHQQIRLKFETLGEAVTYAERHGISYDIESHNDRHRHPMSYADNFRSGRLSPFTH